MRERFARRRPVPAPVEPVPDHLAEQLAAAIARLEALEQRVERIVQAFGGQGVSIE